jgi:PAS domain S-box-containing protein
VSAAEDANAKRLEDAEAERAFSDTMIECMPGILYLYDEHGKFLRWNDSFEKVSGYSGAEIAEMHPQDFFPPDERALIGARIAEVFEHGQAQVEAGFLTKSGRVVPHYFTGRRIEFKGRPCLIGIGMDVSDRSEAQAQLRLSELRYRTLFEYAPDGILIADPQSYYLDANASACRMLGRRRDELIGLHAADIVVPSEVERIEPALDEIKSMADYHHEWQFRRGDDSVFTAEVMVTSMPDGNLLAMIRDVTARNAADAALHELTETLENKVVARTDELHTALVRAEAADRIKSAFLATMSHELRTPLNSILGFTGIILAGMAGPLNAEQSKQLGMVRASARHLLELINDVLDISKIEAEQLEVRSESFDLNAAIAHVVALIQPLADKKGLTMTIDIDPMLNAMHSDRRRVEQILLNLLNNAVKFTEVGAVGLSARLIDEGGAPPCVRMRVRDSGIGIKHEDLGSLFQPFRQLDAGISRQHEGSGLGLVICHRLAVLLGGSVTVASEWSRGSEFTVTLPLVNKPR